MGAFRDAPGGSDSKESACSVGDPGSVPGSGRSPGEVHGNPSSILAWRIPWTEEPGRLQSMRSPRVGHNWATNTFIFRAGMTGRNWEVGGRWSEDRGWKNGTREESRYSQFMFCKGCGIRREEYEDLKERCGLRICWTSSYKKQCSLGICSGDWLDIQFGWAEVSLL